jgi:TPR repeat protein
MNNLAVLLKGSDPGQAQQWFEKAAEAGHAEAMNNLGILLRDSDPGQAQ